MRVITGSARGRRLIPPQGNDVRPTTDTVKEAVFSIIQFSVEGRRFLDAFAGSGQMGIEALSRGAQSALFLDNSRRSVEIIKKNLELCGLSDRAQVLCRSTPEYLDGAAGTFDIIFLDPPYKTGLLQGALERAPRVLSEGGMVICEHPEDEQLPEEVGTLCRKKEYKYGKIRISIYSGREVDGI